MANGWQPTALGETRRRRYANRLITDSFGSEFQLLTNQTKVVRSLIVRRTPIKNLAFSLTNQVMCLFGTFQTKTQTTQKTN